MADQVRRDGPRQAARQGGLRDRASRDPEALDPRGAAERCYQCTPFIRFAIAICSIDAFSLSSFLPDAAAESGKTL